MVLWGFRWLKLFLNPYANDDFEHISESDRRSYILGRLEGAEFSEWSWVVIVAGVGFFTDAYSIFAINMVMPMIDIIYYDGKMHHNYGFAVGVVTLGGSIIGQVGFGLAADIWGRRKMYGLELIITICATLGVVMASNGIHGSMSIIVWLLVWRFVLGIGIGADYPLSAVICSEFAPTHLRGRMLTLVFACQPLGQLAASLVSLIAIVRQRNGIPSDSTAYTELIPQKCDPECLQTLDSVWRWIIGVGVIPAVIALWFRLTIIESPRYTADVGQDSKKAASELHRYLLLQAEPVGARSISLDSNPEIVRRRVSSGAVSGAMSNESGQASRSPSPHSITRAELPGEDTAIKNNEQETIRVFSLPLPSGTSEQRQFANTLSSTQQGNVLSPFEGRDPFRQDLEQTGQNAAPPPPSWKDFKKYFWHDGNFRTLMATSFCWFCLDLPFYGLGMNSPKIISVIWYGKSDPPSGIYKLLIHDIWQSLVVVSLGAIVGCAITFVAIDRLGRRNIQIIGFFWLFILFIIIGGSFYHLYEIGGSAATIVLYILCQIFFNFGPNTTTYIMPAELFPTRYRGLCHGISAAFGKLGSVVAQLFLAFIYYGNGVDYTRIEKWLPYSLLIFSIFMLLGLITTIRWIPGQEHGPDGTVKTLEQWEVGRPTPNGFSNTWTARTVEVAWKFLTTISMRLYLFVDGLAGGDARERREMARLERESEADRERMRELEGLEGGRSCTDVYGGGDRITAFGIGNASDERGPSPFVNGSAHRS
ncbi:Inorganic phosphate transporter pho84 [Cadophora gregata]|uniref:Inorganic phosphate transporter pho84 n=1 Tax=Cadophora gregata TaxID=51156 RepID=UPI0026DCCF26|nr:Inorganic phosphate transporter pho84 [Cadophora gregata]KAK0102539.1 Inorganic phosphate transporter pho84 [Cadophora gregata]KAK0104165.1 Inorganic phosphate transporter pho84 [Cadophora gregata f. sp. sojae]